MTGSLPSSEGDGGDAAGNLNRTYLAGFLFLRGRSLAAGIFPAEFARVRFATVFSARFEDVSIDSSFVTEFPISVRTTLVETPRSSLTAAVSH